MRAVTSSSALRAAAFSVLPITEKTWTGVNNGLTATNVRALAINSASAHLRRNVWRRLSIDGQWRQLDGGQQRLWNFPLSFRWPSIPAETSSLAHSKEAAFIARPTTAITGLLVNNGLTNTYVYCAGHQFERRHLCRHALAAELSVRPTTETVGRRTQHWSHRTLTFHFVSHQRERGYFRRRLIL